MIRDVDSGSRVPDLDFFHPGSATLVLSLSRKLQIDRGHKIFQNMDSIHMSRTFLRTMWVFEWQICQFQSKIDNSPVLAKRLNPNLF
jgi:hypothetical protein